MAFEHFPFQTLKPFRVLSTQALKLKCVTSMAVKNLHSLILHTSKIEKKSSGRQVLIFESCPLSQ